jgi:hypothetical protein
MPFCTKQLNPYIFALRKTTTQLTVNNIFISILFDYTKKVCKKNEKSKAEVYLGNMVFGIKAYHEIYTKKACKTPHPPL